MKQANYIRSLDSLLTYLTSSALTYLSCLQCLETQQPRKKLSLETNFEVIHEKGYYKKSEILKPSKLETTDEKINDHLNYLT